MAESTTASLPFPGSSAKDVITEVLRKGAQQMLAQAIQEEVEEWIGARAELRDVEGRHQVVRNGYLPKRTITSGIGPTEVKQPRVRDHFSETLAALVGEGYVARDLDVGHARACQGGVRPVSDDVRDEPSTTQSGSPT